MIDSRPLAIALMGPTASGKTALAVDWAQRLHSEIISVDSALVYRGLDIGAAKPDAVTQAMAPHRLIDIRDPHQVYSAAEFARDALAVMHELTSQGRIPLLVGGTGLYFRALLDGLSNMPEADPALRAIIASEATEQGWPALHAQLAQVDPEAATRIGQHDAQRIARALEVYRLSGRAISDWQRQTERFRFPFRVLRLVLAPTDRAVLHQRIADRFDAMLAAGFLDEVQRLRADPRLQAHANPRDLPAIRAVGYRQAWAHLDGEISAAQFREAGIAATRQLAKRQLTWLRADLALRWFDPQRDGTALQLALDGFLGARQCYDA